jgi:hypothetical protein
MTLDRAVNPGIGEALLDTLLMGSYRYHYQPNVAGITGKDVFRL